MSISLIINGDGGPADQAGWLGPKVGGLLAPFLYSSHEPSELSQRLCYNDSTINIAVISIIIIIIHTTINTKDKQAG